ncbi:hypothetical protein F2Q69_00040465 [Brassica cretica]|uniref:Uncharacterized protein n=1 Tax=Brassica cretica TaxID=69181 RepID=A0A8S9NI02_BRACR|nr:hypothetical protein F2Q69_00040465 [Brassica cretica]
MASAKNMSLLKDVKAYKIGWPIRVRLPHPWKQNTRSGGETLEFITADETVSRFSSQRQLDDGIDQQRDHHHDSGVFQLSDPSSRKHCIALE